MKYIIAVFSVCLAVVTCQSASRPPPPPGSGLTQLTLPDPPKKAAETPIFPPRPKGCSPGCGPTEICAELGISYCKGNSACSVCIKMSSIRFPASALAGMFTQQQKPQATVPAQQLPVQQAAVNPFSYAPQQPMTNNYNDPFDIFGFNDPMAPQQNNMQNNMFGLMMFDGFGLGGGFGF